MRKLLVVMLIGNLFPAICWSQGFTVSGTQLRDANGNNFIIKGINIPLAWFVNDVNNNVANIRNNTGANCVRIVVNTSTADNAWQTCVERCIANNMIPMLELHDVTGSNSTASLQSMANWWASKASYLTQPNIARYVLINIANEWGDWFMSSPNHTPPQTQWRDAYIAAIQTIRNAGINTTLVVDAPGYGQDFQGSTLLNYAPAVRNSDARNNILFSVHLYCEWQVNGNSNVTTHLPAIKNAGIPIVVGEFGYQHSEGSGTCDINETQIMSTCQSNGIGWLAWSWKGNSSPNQFLDLSNDWAGTSLTSWGNTVVNGANGTKTAQTASVFSGSSSLTVSASSLSFSSASGSQSVSVNSNISWTATDNQSWISLSPASGSNNGSFNVSVTANTSSARSGTVTVTGGGITRTINVSQSGGSCTPTAITPYVQVNNGSWQQTTGVTVNSGATVKFGPQPVSGGSWSWSGPNSFSATTREVTITNIQSTANYMATYTNTSGCQSTQVFTVTVSGGNNAIVVRARGTQGSETIELRVNNSTVASWTLTTAYQNYSDSGNGTVSVHFVNDNGSRDVQVDYVTIGGTTYQAENQATNTGVWQNACGGSYSEWLHCNGYITFSGGGARVASAPSAEESFMEEVSQGNVIEVFPNPVDDKVTVRFREELKGREIHLVNATGKVFLASRLTESEKIIDMSSMAPGLYLIHVTGGTKRHTVRVFRK